MAGQLLVSESKNSRQNLFPERSYSQSIASWPDGLFAYRLAPVQWAVAASITENVGRRRSTKTNVFFMIRQSSRKQIPRDAHTVQMSEDKKCPKCGNDGTPLPAGKYQGDDSRVFEFDDADNRI